MHVGADEIQHHLLAAVDGDGRGGAGHRRRRRCDLIDHGMGERRGAAGGRRPDGRLLGLVISVEVLAAWGDCQCFSVGSSISPAVPGPVEVGGGSA